MPANEKISPSDRKPDGFHSGHNDLSMVVLAGGKSSRMGTDKCDLLYQGRTFLEHQIETGRTLGISDIIVSGYHGLHCSVPVIPDRFSGRGPLGGLEACFRKLKNAKCLVLSVDVPLLDPLDLLGLAKAGKTSPAAAVILRHGGRLEPLIGVYSTDLADGISAYLETGRGSVLGFLKHPGFEIYESRASGECFENVNDPAAYERLTLHK